MNHESVSWSHKPKICNTSIFHKSFFAKCDNFKIISAGDIYLSICLQLNEWNWLMKDKNATNFFIHSLNKFVLKKKKKLFLCCWFSWIWCCISKYKHPVNACKLDWKENIFYFYVQSIAFRIKILIKITSI